LGLPAPVFTKAMPGAMQTQFASLLSLSLYFLLKFPSFGGVARSDGVVSFPLAFIGLFSGVALWGMML